MVGTKMRRAACLVTAAAALAIGASPPAKAGEAEARALFKAMSDYLAAQTAISFDYDASVEVVTTDGQKLALASSGKVDLARPDKIRATRKGGFADVEMVFDGKTLSLLGKGANGYTQVPMPGSIDNLVDTLRDTFHRPMPGADLLLANVNDALIPLATDAKDLGSGVIRGTECDHLAFRTQEVDWQIWIAQGDKPYPCRYVVTTKDVEGMPQYTFDISGWKTGADATASFDFTPPADAKKLGPKELAEFADLPEHFSLGAQQ